MTVSLQTKSCILNPVLSSLTVFIYHPVLSSLTVFIYHPVLSSLTVFMHHPLLLSSTVSMHSASSAALCDCLCALLPVLSFICCQEMPAVWVPARFSFSFLWSSLLLASGIYQTKRLRCPWLFLFGYAIFKFGNYWQPCHPAIFSLLQSYLFDIILHAL